MRQPYHAGSPLGARIRYARGLREASLRRNLAALELATEATSHDELVEASAQLMRTLDVPSWLLYGIDSAGVRGFGGQNVDELFCSYRRDGFDNQAPHWKVKRERNPDIMISSRFIEPRQLKGGAAYNDLFRHFDVEHQLSWRVSAVPHFEPGMLGMMLFRGRSQRDFGGEDTRQLRWLAAAFAAAARRLDKIARVQDASAVVESMLVDIDPRPRLALDVKGRLLWLSPRAEELIRAQRRHWRVPAPLVVAAKRLARGEDAFTVELTAPAVRAELSLSRTVAGTRFVVVELDDCDGAASAPRVQHLATRRQLTLAETEVLGLLAMGLANSEIARRRHTSLDTVKTHVHRILAKLGVRSRTQAALLARGQAAVNHSLE
jgi:DNA-binding CsgD family transcriptional regulator